MKRKQIIILLIAAVALGGVAYLTSLKNATPSPTQMGKWLLPGLSINDIAAIRMTSKGSTTTLNASKDGWGVESKHGYPANYEKLHRAVIGLADIKIAHEISVTDAQKADMNITEASDRVQFLDAKETVLGDIILGDLRTREAAPENPYGGYPNGRFISTDGGKSVVVISETLEAFSGATPNSWLDTDLLSVPGTEVTSIRISGNKRQPISFARNPEDDKWVPTDLVQGETLSTNMSPTVQDALNYLQLADVADPSLTDKQLGMDDPVVFESMTKNGVLYVVKLGGSPKNSEDRYARISASYIGNAQAVDTPMTVAEDAAARKAIVAETNKARADAEIINARLEKWTYIIPSYKADSMTKLREDYIDGTPVASEPEIDTTPTASAPKDVAKPDDSQKVETETKAEDK